MINRSLNYGRHLIRKFLHDAAPYGSVLDLGAGHGTDLEIAREVCPNSALVAVEVHPPYVAALEDRAIKVLPLNIERDTFPLPSESLDVVIANQVLEHTKEVFWIFHEVTRTLKVGGRFIIGVPNLASLHNRVLLSIGRQPSPIKTASAHVRGFTKPDLLHFISECFPAGGDGGYRLVSWGGSNFYPLPPLLAKPLARALPGLAWGLFLVLEKTHPYKNEFIEYPVSRKLETNFWCGELR